MGRSTWCLVVKSNQLTSDVPVYLRHIIAGIEPCALGVNPGHLPHVVLDVVFWLLFDVSYAFLFREGGHEVTTVHLWMR